MTTRPLFAFGEDPAAGLRSPRCAATNLARAQTDLPAPSASAPEGSTEALLLAGLPRPAGQGPHSARRSHRGGLGQSRHPPGSVLEKYETEHDWPTTVRLPSYAPDLNPVEAVWSLVRRAMANTAFDTPHDLDRKLRRESRRIQLRSLLTNGCLTATGLAIDPPTPP
ncbi:transposase [Streptomyces sp. NPDC029006]|uniref:transposase n=1 Tax=Streptomyces sp. NPDC029006 TaxID=3155467 RepID=UPI0033D1BBB0